VSNRAEHRALLLERISRARRTTLIDRSRPPSACSIYELVSEKKGGGSRRDRSRCNGLKSSDELGALGCTIETPLCYKFESPRREPCQVHMRATLQATFEWRSLCEPLFASRPLLRWSFSVGKRMRCHLNRKRNNVAVFFGCLFWVTRCGFAVRDRSSPIVRDARRHAVRKCDLGER